MNNLCYFTFVLFCFHARQFVDALWSPAGKRLTSWLSFVMFNCDVTFYIVILGQVWCLISSNPDLCSLSYFLSGYLFIYAFIFDKTIHFKRHRLPPSRLNIHNPMPGLCI